jgi:hypothetical protein
MFSVQFLRERMEEGMCEIIALIILSVSFIHRS